ncbi:MAG: PD-(D/E)XK nuclease family protein [Desulfovibrio sp.]|jgi:hypothetical protein|nr:PD-(D/E)XK nuclease family protein [Desulfovibrio sp.]
MRHPFLLVPLRLKFLSILTDIALRDTDGDLGRAVFIFPHARPARYLTLALREKAGLKKPLILPRMYTVDGIIEELERLILPYPRRKAGLLDRVGLLLAALREEGRETDMPFNTEAEVFFPWGIRLAALFEECFTQMKTPVNFLYAEDRASPFAQTLLARLRPLFVRYRALLDAGEYSTDGLSARMVAEFVAAQGKMPENFLGGSLFSSSGTVAGKSIYLAGFHMPTCAENIIFHRMWEDMDARVVVHADEALLSHGGTEAHWSCLSFPDWAAEWGSSLELAPGCAGERAEEARIRFYAAYDLHSQLQILQKELEKNNDKDPGLLFSEGGEFVPPDPGTAGDRPVDTAVFLPHGDLLMPVLHHLPHTDVNISMGWPLSRSPLARLLDTAARLQEGRRGDAYYRRDLLDLLRHPYVKMLRPEAAEKNSGTAESWRRELHRLDLALRTHGRKYTNLVAIIEETYQLMPPEELPPAPVLNLLEELCRVFLDAFAGALSAAKLASALDGVCRLLLRRGARLLERFPVDAECLYRLRRSLIPELSGSEMSAEQLPREAIFALLRGLLENERVPFEAEPLVGLQIMGMLESRLIAFRRVIIVDAVEDALPGSPEGDPLLPDALRPELGLPSRYNREQLAAHTFFSLVAGAEELVLLWREGEDSSTPGRKNKKSRFVEELIWHEEKKRRNLLSGQENDGTLTLLSPSVPPVSTTRRSIVSDDATRNLVGKLLERQVSASLLDAYLLCPAKFFYERLARITPAIEPEEGDDPLAVGNMLHAALLEFYSGRLHVRLPAGAELPRGDLDLLKKLVFGSNICSELLRRLPGDSRIMLEEAVEKRLTAYLDKQPATTVLAAECRLTASFACSFAPGRGGTEKADARLFTLAGTVDRLDLRQDVPEHFKVENVRTAQGRSAAARFGGAGETAFRRQTPKGASQNQIASEATRKKPPSPEDAVGRDKLAEIVVLDYKTGIPAKIPPTIWRDSGLLKRLKAWNGDDEAGERTGTGAAGLSLLAETADRLPSVQLPFYLLLHSLAREQGRLPPGPDRHKTVEALNAAWVDLGGDGGENFLFPDDFSCEERRETIREYIPALLNFLLRHMLTARQVPPRPGRHCDWCSSKKLCMMADRRAAPGQQNF